MAQLRRSRACILGAAGFIGRHVVSKFLASGYDVTAVDREEGLSEGLSRHRRLDFQCGRLQDDSFVRRVLAGIETVICLAPNSLPATSNADIAAEIDTQVRTTLRIAEIAQQAGCRSFVFASSGGTVYGLDSPTAIPETAPTCPRSAYGVSKLAIEHYLRILRELRGFRTISLRISNPYGVGQNASNNQGFIAMAMRRLYAGETLQIWGDGQNVRDFIYVQDLAEAFVRAAEYMGEHHVINIGSGLGYTLSEIVQLVEKVAGRRLQTDYGAAKGYDVRKNVLDISLALRELGWAPRTSIEQGLRETALWWESRRITLA